MQIAHGQHVAQPGDLQDFRALLLVDELLKGAHGGLRGLAIAAVHLGRFQKPHFGEHFLHEADGFLRGFGSDTGAGVVLLRRNVRGLRRVARVRQVPAPVVAVLQIAHGQHVAQPGDLQNLRALLVVDELLEGAHGGLRLFAVAAIHGGGVHQADFRKHFLYEGDAFHGGVRANAVAGLLLRRHLGGFGGLGRCIRGGLGRHIRGSLGRHIRGGLGRRTRGGLGRRTRGHGDHAVVLHAVLQIGLGERVATAADLKGLLAPLFVDPVLEGFDCGDGALAVNAVHVGILQEADFAEHFLHGGDFCLRGGRVDDARTGGLGLSGGGRGRGGGCGGGCGGLLLLLPPLHIVVQIGHGVGIHRAGDLQRGVTLKLIDADLEVLHRRGGAGSVFAVRAALGKQTQGDQLVLHGANLRGRGFCVDGAVVGRGGDRRLRRGRGPSQRHRGVIEPLLGLFARDAVHGELFGRGAVFVDVVLEILHRLFGGGVVGAADFGAAQPTQLAEALLELFDAVGAGGAADRAVIRIGVHSGLLRGGRAGLLLVFAFHVAGVGVIHPGKLRIHQRRKRGGGVGRGRGRFRRHPGGTGRGAGERVVQRHVVRIAHGIEEPDQADGHHQHHCGRDGDGEYDLLFVVALVLVHILRSGAARGGIFALGDVSRAVFFEIEVALAGILHALHAGAQFFHAGVEGVLHARDGHDRAVVEALGAVAGQVFADADHAAALGVHGGIDDTARILAQGAPHQKAVVVDQRAGQHLNLRHGGAGIPAAVGADGLAAHVPEAVHAKVFVSHIFHSFGGKSVRALNRSAHPRPRRRL